MAPRSMRRLLCFCIPILGLSFKSVAAPSISTQPVSQSYLAGTNAYFNVVASGSDRCPAAAQPYLSGPLTLSGSTNLQIDYGATLRALPYSSGTATISGTCYPLNGSSYKNFINCSSAHDVEISGPGTIDGHG